MEAKENPIDPVEQRKAYIREQLANSDSNFIKNPEQQANMLWEICRTSPELCGEMVLDMREFLEKVAREEDPNALYNNGQFNVEEVKQILEKIENLWKDNFFNLESDPQTLPMFRDKIESMKKFVLRNKHDKKAVFEGILSSRAVLDILVGRVQDYIEEVWGNSHLENEDRSSGEAKVGGKYYDEVMKNMHDFMKDPHQDFYKDRFDKIEIKTILRELGMRYLVCKGQEMKKIGPNEYDIFVNQLRKKIKIRKSSPVDIMREQIKSGKDVSEGVLSKEDIENVLTNLGEENTTGGITSLRKMVEDAMRSEEMVRQARVIERENFERTLDKIEKGSSS